MRAARARAAARRRSEARERRERKLRALVTRLSGCLDLLPGAEGRYLGLRAGAGDSKPLSRRAAAERAGVPAKRAATTERRGLRRLRRAARAGGCGAGSARTNVALTGSTGPALQPAVLMAPAPPALRTPSELASERDGGSDRGEASGSGAGSGDGEGQGVKGVSESSPRSAATLVADVVDEPGVAGYYVLVAVLAALLLAFVLLQRRARGAWTEPVTAAALAPPPALPAPETPAEPQPVPLPQPSPDPAEPPPAAALPAHPAAPGSTGPSRRRQAAIAAGSVASLAATALLRRRRR